MLSRRECHSESKKLVEAVKSDFGHMVEGRGDLLIGAFDILIDEMGGLMADMIFTLSRGPIVDTKKLQATKGQYDTRANEHLRTYWIEQGSPGTLEGFMRDTDKLRRRMSKRFTAMG